MIIVRTVIRMKFSTDKDNTSGNNNRKIHGDNNENTHNSNQNNIISNNQNNSIFFNPFNYFTKSSSTT